jgi:hypothetical protein
LAEIAQKGTAERQYLLGGLSEAERTRIEEAFFADDSKFEAIELAEDELIDAYVRKELSAAELKQFNSKLRTSPRFLERVHFAQALAERASNLVPQQDEALIQSAISVPPAKVGWWQRWVNLQSGHRLAFAACVVLLLVGGVALFASFARLRNESDRFVAERAALQRQKDDLDKQLSEQRTRSDQLAAEFQRLKEQRAEDLKLIEKLQRAETQKETGDRQSVLSTFASVLLTPGALRSGDGGQAELVIQPGTTKALVQLALEKNEYRAYNILMTTVDGAFVTRKNGLKPHNSKSGPQLLLSVPARFLRPDNYVVHVDGVIAPGQVEDVSDYAFRVTKR